MEWSLREEFMVEGLVDDHVLPLLHTCERHVGTDRAGAATNLQVHDGSEESLPLSRMRREREGGCDRQLLSLHCQDWMLPALVDEPRRMLGPDGIESGFLQWRKRPFWLLGI